MSRRFPIEDNNKLQEKMSFLEENGFNYNFDRDIFINQNTLTVTSIEFVDDHSLDEIKKDITSPNKKNKPRFLFNHRFSRNKRLALAAEIFPKYHPNKP